MPLTTIYGDGNGTRVIGDSSFLPQPIHPDVGRFITTLRTASTPYTMTRTEVDAINTFVWACEANGIWSKMQVVYPFLGDNQVAQSFNLKNVSTFQITWVGSAFTFSSANGFQKNATDTTSYGLTGYIPNTSQTVNDAHISCYVGTQQTGSGFVVPFAAISATNVWLQVCSGFGANANVAIQGSSASAAAVLFTIPTVNTGYILGTRTAVNSLKAFYNGINVGTNTNTATTSRTTLQVAVGLQNGPTSRLYPCTQAIRFASIGSGLNDAESYQLSQAVQNYQTKLGRQV
jgi:hypothetical protein